MITKNQHLPNLAKKLGLPDLYFKREDKHPFFSHKGRSIPAMIDFYFKKDANKFVISSSGNAGLACALYIKILNKNLDENKKNKKINLKIFVSKNIEAEKEKKLNKLCDEYISLEKVEKPRQKMMELGKKGFQIIRQSNDDTALIGLENLAKEISKVANLKAIFFPVSSGALLQGVAEKLAQEIKIFAVQTEKCHPIASEFDKDFKSRESLAKAIIDNVGLRKQKIVNLIKKRGGGGFVVNNNLIKKAIEIFKKETGEILNPNGALAFAGLLKALDVGVEFNGPVVCVVGGN